ncbi:coiled-coil domain-containing protein 181 isoform X1 [Phyllopteryx taeniolatus]|uniref:coiled-coil domain-containing protein 181 isoform X1 n=1 Tax=Phyllopteryx taeniolatus TaxID=161469 RepID=UPI002AD45332|nr:coiled-coil domain-containing protein 181 isoform X1 [Phyllopteryx taeniolatus]
MSEVVCTKSQEVYEDDFEKDLDWLISEESCSEQQGPDDEDIEADIDKELAEDEKQHKAKERSNNAEEQEDNEDRWPSPMDPLEVDSDRDSPNKSFLMTPPPLGVGEQTDEEKKYIREKIQQANRELRDQEAPNLSRGRRLQFKETLVTLVVPPLQFECDAGEADGTEMEVSGKLSELKLSPREEFTGGKRDEGLKEGRVLVEKDGRFDLVSLKEVENQGLLPPLAQEQPGSPRRSPTSVPSSRSPAGASSLFQKSDHLRAPRPPGRPSSACHSQRGGQRRGTKRRVQSATGTPSQATFKLSPQQKEMLHKTQERKEKIAREAEQRKLEEEEQKKQENELAFKAWLMRKREQLQQERRIRRAQEMERMTPRESSEPEEAFRLWLQRKQEQQQREKQLVQLRRLEEDGGYLLRSREECERAFKLWLTRKQVEKREEQRAARERARRFVLEERRARRMRDLLCTASDARTFRFTDQLTCRF